MLTNFLAGMAEGAFERLVNSDTQQHEQAIRAFTAAVQAATAFLHESPEFRRALAHLLAELLKFEESREVVVQGLQAVGSFATAVGEDRQAGFEDHCPPAGVHDEPGGARDEPAGENPGGERSERPGG